MFIRWMIKMQPDTTKCNTFQTQRSITKCSCYSYVDIVFTSYGNNIHTYMVGEQVLQFPYIHMYVGILLCVLLKNHLV